jgi:class 3 adenylate cyclase
MGYNAYKRADRMVTTGELASQTLAFLFTDIEGSTRLWEQYRQSMKDALERHDAILREAVESSSGQVVKSTGDGFMVVFASAADGVSACQLSTTSRPHRGVKPERFVSVWRCT